MWSSSCEKDLDQVKTLGPKLGTQWISYLIDLSVAKCKLCPSVTFIVCMLQFLYLKFLYLILLVVSIYSHT